MEVLQFSSTMEHLINYCNLKQACSSSYICHRTIYLTPSVKLSSSDTDDLITQLPTPVCLVWQVIPDQHGSDHFPVQINAPDTSPPVTNCTWKLTKADWATFQHRASVELDVECLENTCETLAEDFTNILIEVAVLFQEVNLEPINAIPYS